MVVVHTFRAGRFEEAIAQVKRTLGEDALIVSRRDLGPHELRLGEARGVEVTAMSVRDAQRDHVDERAASALGMLDRRLRNSGVPERATDTLIAALAKRQSGRELGPAALQELLAGVLREELMFGGGLSGARVIALVGPTGVGKTTTIAKLAAHEQLVKQQRVGLITIDEYRVGGVEQLGRYADLIGCPMEVASDARSLEVALRKLSKADLVLVDTAGRSPRDAWALTAMAECLHGAQEPIEVHLCLPVAMRERELRTAVEHCSVLSPSRLTCTKVDEAICCGTIVAAHVQSGLPLGYFTTGQRVPEDISVASAELLAALLCGEDVN
jgi:flagellar biosynthesis protein FlhF